MTRRDELARVAARAAAEFRLRQGYGRATPICPMDEATRIGIQVWLVPAPSLEGMYCKDRGPSIVISTERPAGRQTFTAGHELGHHIFDHGTRSDEYLSSPAAVPQFDPDEFLADMFSAHLLMPPAAVREAFGVRGTSVSAAPARVMYAVSTWLGVGYETLIGHLERTLKVLPSRHADVLRKESPKSLRIAMLGEDAVPHLVLADTQWVSRSIDLRVGDGVLLAKDCVHEGGRLERVRDVAEGQLAIATRRGLGRVESPSTGWSSFVRVMPRRYDGMGRFRFDEDCDENACADDDL